MNTMTATAHFDGKTYDHQRDHARLRTSLDRVHHELKKGAWVTLAAMSIATGTPQASVSARMRDLRKQKFGGHVIERRYVRVGLHEYRMVS